MCAVTPHVFVWLWNTGAEPHGPTQYPTYRTLCHVQHIIGDRQWAVGSLELGGRKREGLGGRSVGIYSTYVHASQRVACPRCNEQIAHLQFRALRSLSGRAAVALERTRRKKKTTTNHSTCPRICFAPFLSRKSNRHLRLLTLALNREDAQDISAVVRVRRCPSRSCPARLYSYFRCAGPATRCGAVPGFLPGFGLPRLAFCIFQSRRRG